MLAFENFVIGTPLFYPKQKSFETQDRRSFRVSRGISPTAVLSHAQRSAEIALLKGIHCLSASLRKKCTHGGGHLKFKSLHGHNQMELMRWELSDVRRNNGRLSYIREWRSFTTADDIRCVRLASGKKRFTKFTQRKVVEKKQCKRGK